MGKPHTLLSVPACHPDIAVILVGLDVHVGYRVGDPFPVRGNVRIADVALGIDIVKRDKALARVVRRLNA
jgi:hypothetical protein